VEEKQIERVLVKPEEGAVAIGCSRSMIYKLVADGILPCVYLDPGRQRLMRIPVAALRALADRATPVIE
jgi:hypothetical protein